MTDGAAPTSRSTRSRPTAGTTSRRSSTRAATRSGVGACSGGSARLVRVDRRGQPRPDGAPSRRAAARPRRLPRRRVVGWVCVAPRPPTTGSSTRGSSRPSTTSPSGRSSASSSDRNARGHGPRAAAAGRARSTAPGGRGATILRPIRRPARRNGSRPRSPTAARCRCSRTPASTWSASASPVAHPRPRPIVRLDL